MNRSNSANEGHALLQAAAIIVGAGTLLWLSAFNGFPLVFPDTFRYLSEAFHGVHVAISSHFYAYFIRYVARNEMWAVVLLQALAAAWTVLWILRRAFDLRLGSAVAILFVLCAISTLPVYVGLLMTDVWIALAAMAAITIYWERGATLPELILGFGLIVFGVLAHQITGPLLLGLTGILCCHCAFQTLQSKGPVRLSRVGIIAAAVGSGLLILSANNLRVWSMFTPSPQGPLVSFAFLLRGGVMEPEIDRLCPEEELRVCSVADQLPYGRGAFGKFLHPKGALNTSLGGWRDFRGEARRLVTSAIVNQSLVYAGMVRRETALQLSLYRSDGHFQRGYIPGGAGRAVLDNFDPPQGLALRSSRQATGTFDLQTIDRVTAMVTLLGAIVILSSVLIRGRATRPRSVALTVLSLYIAQALLIGAITAPAHRYAARLSWSVTMAALALGVSLWRTRRGHGASSAQT